MGLTLASSSTTTRAPARISASTDAPPPATDAATAATTATTTTTPTLPTLPTLPKPSTAQSDARARALSGGAVRMAQLAATPTDASAQAAAAPPSDDMTKKVAQYQQDLMAYRTAYGAYQKSVDDYWSNMKSVRKAGGFVTEQPPGKYEGPAKPVNPNPDPVSAPTAPAAPTSTIPKKDTFIAQANAVYGFTPDTGTEAQFKQSYADEAKRAGLDVDQVVGVYAFETGGNGLADDQPIRKDGTAISTALGYSQLLNASTVGLLGLHGEEFAAQLDAAGKCDKAAIVRRMAADAKTAGDTEEQQQIYAKTPAGRAMQATCLDVDIGPKLQVQNLIDISKNAEKLGLSSHPPAPQLELMNLAGEKNGAGMLAQPDLPTANFFTRAGYEANAVVRGHTGAELLARITKDMGELGQKKGSQDLRAAFGAT